MFAVVITEKGGAQRREEFDQSEVTIGRVQGNDIILPKGNVSKRHSRIVLKDSRFIVVDLKSTNGTYVNGRKITSPLVVKVGDKIYIGDFIITVEPTGASARDGASGNGAPGNGAPGNGAPNDAARAQAKPDGASIPPPVPSKASGPPPMPAAPRPQAHQRAPQQDDEASSIEPRGAAEPRATEAPGAFVTAAPPASAGVSIREPRPRGQRAAVMATEAGLGDGDEALRLIMSRVAADFDVHAHYPGALHDQDRWATAQRAIQRALDHLMAEGAFSEGIDLDALGGAALRETVGLGALEGLLADERVHEIVVNGPSHVMVDFGAGLELVEATFSDVTMLVTIARRLLSQGGRELDPARPMQQVTLPYGPHVSVLLPPLAVRGPVLEIRRIHKGRTLEELVSGGVLDANMVELLEAAVERRCRIVVAGPSSSGVTATLGAIVQRVDLRERLVTAEAVPDLALDRPGTISLAASRIEGRISLSDVIYQASQLRSDRVVIDDVAGPELVEALTCLASRHAGDFLGVHVGHDADCLAPLRLLGQLGPAVDAAVFDRLIAHAVDLMVEVARLPEGHRVVGITEVTVGVDGQPETTALFTYDGAFRSTGKSPSFAGG